MFHVKHFDINRLNKLLIIISIHLSQNNLKKINKHSLFILNKEMFHVKHSINFNLL